ncbi:MAG: LOG family protein [bacterium]|nr:LOG family protein [bacterium]
MQYKIAVSGAAQLTVCSKDAPKLAEEIGKEIVRQGCILITGATTGIPYYAAKGAKKAKGISIGFSPAATEKAHIKSYKLPIDAFDVIVYTGFDYAGRNLLMTRAADGIIVICGRMGTLNEFTIAFEDQKPIGVLEGSGGTADKIRDLTKGPFRGEKKIVYSKEPKELVAKLIQLIKKEKYNNSK